MTLFLIIYNKFFIEKIKRNFHIIILMIIDSDDWMQLFCIILIHKMIFFVLKKKMTKKQKIFYLSFRFAKQWSASWRTTFFVLVIFFCFLVLLDTTYSFTGSVKELYWDIHKQCPSFYKMPILITLKCSGKIEIIFKIP